MRLTAVAGTLQGPDTTPPDDTGESGGGPVLTYASWSDVDHTSGVVLASSNTNASHTASQRDGVRANFAIPFPVYWEVPFVTAGSGEVAGIGIALKAFDLATHYVGQESDSVGLWFPAATVYKNNVLIGDFTGESSGTAKFAYDPVTGKLWMGTILAGWYSGDPELGTSPIATVTAGTGYYPALTLEPGNVGNYIGNFDPVNFVGVAPNGFLPLGFSDFTPATYSYYRVLFSAAQSGAYISLAKVEFRDSVGGTNLASGGTPSADSFYSAGYESDKAFDADATTVWASAATFPHWLKYTFPGPVTVGELAIQAVNSGYGTLTESPKDFVLQYSPNNTDWTTVLSATGQTSWSYGQVRTYAVSQVNYPPDDPAPPALTPYSYRLLVSDANGDTSFNLASFIMRQTVGGTNIVADGTASASAVGGGSSASYAFDGDSTTSFVSGSGLPQWIEYTFPDVQDVVEVLIRPVPTAFGSLTGCPKDFLFQQSIDGGAWTTLITATGQTDWDYGVIRTYAVSVGTYGADPIEPPPDEDPVYPWPTRLRGTYSTSITAFGAVGNGTHNDTAAIQAALDSVPSDGGTVIVPAGTFLVDPIISIKPKSKTLLLGLTGNRIITKPNGLDTRYSTILIPRTSTEVELADLVVVGDRLAHTGTTGEAGHCIRTEGATKVTIRGCSTTNAWGDGLIISGAAIPGGYSVSDDIFVYNHTSDNNRRQGCTIGICRNVQLWLSTFKGTNGTAPQAGIDMEPGDTVPATNILVDGCIITDNAGAGINFWGIDAGVIVRNTEFARNKWGLYVNNIDGLEIHGNLIHNNLSSGIRVLAPARNVTIYSNNSYQNDGKAARATPLLGKVGYDTTVQTDIRVNAAAVNINVQANDYR
jgi:hypothetical protein